MAWTFNVGANATPTPATGVPLSFGENFVIGAAGRASVTMSGGSQDFVQTSLSSNVNYRFDNGRWKVETGVTQSAADFVRDNRAHGHFLGAGATLRQTVRLTYSDINSVRPGPNNQEVDIYNIVGPEKASLRSECRRGPAGIRAEQGSKA